MSETVQPRGVWIMPTLIVGLLCSQVAVCAYTIYMAHSDPSAAIEPDYYQKALRWDERAAQQRENQALGWRVELAVQAGPEPASAPAGRTLRLTVADALERPLEGCQAEVTMFARARAGHRERAALASVAPGVYACDVDLAAPGWWEFRATLRRGPDTFTLTRLIDVDGRG